MFPRLEVERHLLGVLGLLGVRLLVGHRDVLQDLLHVGLEAHVDHAVGLVQDHVGAAAQHQVAVLQHVDETTGGGDHNLSEEQRNTAAGGEGVCLLGTVTL